MQGRKNTVLLEDAIYGVQNYQAMVDNWRQSANAYRLSPQSIVSDRYLSAMRLDHLAAQLEQLIASRTYLPDRRRRVRPPPW